MIIYNHSSDTPAGGQAGDKTAPKRGARWGRNQSIFRGGQAYNHHNPYVKCDLRRMLHGEFFAFLWGHRRSEFRSNQPGRSRVPAAVGLAQRAGGRAGKHRYRCGIE